MLTIDSIYRTITIRFRSENKPSRNEIYSAVLSTFPKINSQSIEILDILYDNDDAEDAWWYTTISFDVEDPK